jgi:hypothetical protein
MIKRGSGVAPRPIISAVVVCSWGDENYTPSPRGVKVGRTDFRLSDTFLTEENRFFALGMDRHGEQLLLMQKQVPKAKTLVFNAKIGTDY